MYLLDSNIFIQAKNREYGFEFCPAFWDFIIIENQNNNIFSIDKVKDELDQGGDELSIWAKEHKNIFLPSNIEILPFFDTINNSLIKLKYTQGARNDFMQVADYYLIAHALHKQCAIITHEVPKNTLKKVQIPNICLDLNIKFMNIYDLLKTEKPQFILKHK